MCGFATRAQKGETASCSKRRRELGDAELRFEGVEALDLEAAAEFGEGAGDEAAMDATDDAAASVDDLAKRAAMHTDLALFGFGTESLLGEERDDDLNRLVFAQA